MNADSFKIQHELSMTDSLVQLSFHIQAILGRAGADHDLSVIQIRLLGILRDREPSMQQLAHYLSLDKSSITGLIDRAERRGLVERTPSPTDRRGFQVKVTPAGRELTLVVSKEIEAQIHALTEAISEPERAQFVALTAKLLGITTNTSKGGV
ncbi:MarR family winged helix-turn-helix transcriptional regulator [Paenibacillus silvisoli]|uniref:MarR family winged helix-turn-helix transcriptional regulator n=1 Tax=Paenibacillus silvisoli TaxID=3110539 RepID=UPI00280556D8|nr:MarR family transcriptional regulator [Paenibacillus silvisoli]